MRDTQIRQPPQRPDWRGDEPEAAEGAAQDSERERFADADGAAQVAPDRRAQRPESHRQQIHAAVNPAEQPIRRRRPRMRARGRSRGRPD